MGKGIRSTRRLRLPVVSACAERPNRNYVHGRGEGQPLWHPQSSGSRVHSGRGTFLQTPIAEHHRASVGVGPEYPKSMVAAPYH